ncbi:hypothetical protein FPOAC2_05812 [Fusarium poae]|jgi:ATP-binding cassette subfamily B (MDR/TAP) protein 1|uniref:hypothetical protein n=1 Tax=Fusarium poae TaxID=36050 RepID=UPI001CE9797D|nr:hypothetical protein FPOAC1_005695 [Fusarium poae]KAG8672425.1 hypothetical protein FPOAC1_005695 [Fusarium poae]
MAADTNPLNDNGGEQEKPPPVAENNERPQRTPKVSDYIRVFNYATKWDFFIYALASVASIGAGITMPLMNIIFGQLVNQFTEFSQPGTGISTDGFRDILDKQVLYIVGLFIGRWGLNTINKYCFRMIGIRLSSAIRLHYLESLFSQSIHVIDSMPAGAPATAITSTSNTLQVGISERLGTFLEYNGTIWASIIVAFVWSWDITLVTACIILYMATVLSITMPILVKGHTATGAADAQGTAIASEALQGIRLVTACGAQSRVVSRYQEWVRKAMLEGQKIAPFTGMHLGLIFFGVFGAFGLSFWYGTKRYIDGAIDNPGVIIIVLMSVMLIITSLERVATPLMAISKAMIAACEFFTVIDAPLPTSGSLKPDITSCDIVFDGVTFEYPSRPGVCVLNDLSLCIRSGQNTAIVGPSGSGKSTIVGLLERWYSLKEHHRLPQVIQATPKKKPDESTEGMSEKTVEASGNVTLAGTISISDHSIEDLDLKWWRSQIGLVQQEPFLFNDTIFNNVAHGLIGSEWQDESEVKRRERVSQACKEAYADEFINRLPDGYDTRVGDGGAKLSGGQKQRLAIARSIIKQPRIIILDEATSAIDAKSEKIVQAALDRVTQGRTTITIAHRLSTIKKADNIIVLQKGKVVEQGAHADLIAKAGVYSALVGAQALRVAEEADNTTAVPDAEKIEYSSEIEATKMNSSVSSGDESGDVIKPRGFFQSFGRLLHEQRGKWPNYLGIVMSSMAVAAATPLQAWLFAKAIGVFLFQGDELKSESDFLGLMWLALAGGVALSYFCEGWIGLRTQYHISAVYKSQYLNDMLYQKMAFFDQEENSHGTLSSRVSGDAKQLEELLGLNLALMISSMFNVIGCMTISVAFGWKLGLICMSVALPVMLAAGRWKLKHEVHFDKMNSAVFMESSQFATEAIEAIRTVSSLTMEDSINGRYRDLLDGHVKAANRKAQWTSAIFGLADSISLGVQALLLWYGGTLLASGEYSMEAFFVCFMAVIQGAEAGSTGLALAPSVVQVKTSANRILDVQRSVDSDHLGTARQQCVATDTDGGVRIELRDVSFKYPTRDGSVFDHLNLTIEKGQYAAFVGASGCGKTTIISLLERFYDVQPGNGAILCEGRDIKDSNVFEYRESISLVSQESAMFRGSVRDNILFGISDPDSISDERIHQVCRDAFIHDFIVSLPEGYNTDVGHRGVSMSGGQKQRIAIARALIRDPQLLLLDEATSALDSESEKVVAAAIDQASSGRTVISVAHRLSTIQNADVIFVFDDGKVIEKGTHTELVNKHGIYWEMCQSQALDR